MNKFTYGPKKTAGGKSIRTTHSLDCTIYEALIGVMLVGTIVFTIIFLILYVQGA